MRSRLAAAAVVGFLVASGAVGCSSDDSGLPEPVAPQTAGPPAEEVVELSAEEQEAVDGARAAFDAFMTAYNEILTAGEPATDEVLSRILPYVAGDAGGVVNGEIFENFQANIRQEGRVEWTFLEVLDVDLGNVYVHGGEEYPVPLVELRYCVDATSWIAVDKDTGEPTSPSGARLITRSDTAGPAVVQADYFDPLVATADEIQPRWRVVTWEEEDNSC